ncbi:DUF1223 domain-containing protein [Ideonella sp. YS5]|uniref:DUF1223 domain-containing protein n=1 Tax=Ideonella sp. YS5 TaxID=3453714 RepID=UPI003F6ECB80
MTVCALSVGIASAAPLDCRLAPATGKRVLAELFSSEGCDACPPAERLFAGLAPGPEQVAIVWHVDYFDAQGWKDRFALPESSRRHQSLAMRQPGPKIVATPQVYLDGAAFNDWRDARTLRSRVLRGASATPALTLAFTQVDRSDAGWQLQLGIDAGAAAPTPLRWQAVLLQSGLSSQVSQGENQGLTLLHGHVVRSATGPLAASGEAPPRTVRLQLPAASTPPAAEGEIDLVAWAEDVEGKVLNATWARCP